MPDAGLRSKLVVTPVFKSFNHGVTLFFLFIYLLDIEPGSVVPVG